MQTPEIPGFTPVGLGPGIFAGFTASAGGVSEQPWHSLNLGPNVNDNPAHVHENRKIVAETFGTPIAFAEQVHGNDILVIDDDIAATYLNNANPPIAAGKVDGMVTPTGLGLGVLVADCVPILLASQNAVAVAHAGRRGIELGVINEAITKIREITAQNGGDPTNIEQPEITAAIGPAICGNCYEVPIEMQKEVCAHNPKAKATTSWGTPGLDLPAAAQAQLEAAGVKVVYRSPICTFEDERYFSHRRATANGTTTGRQAGIIARRISD